MYQGISPLLALSQDCGQVALQLTRRLSTMGCQVIRTFDLQAARAAHPGVVCPRHGTPDCPCQLIVLLVYGLELAPITLILQGHDEYTRVALVNRPGQTVPPRQEALVLRILAPQNFPALSRETPAAIAA